VSEHALVRRVCVAGPHVAIKLAQATRGIMPTAAAMTIIEREWALCAAGQADGHVWNLLEPTVTVIDALTVIARSREAGLIGASPDDGTTAFLDRGARAERPSTS
jgi:hypothetical protein